MALILAQIQQILSRDLPPAVGEMVELWKEVYGDLTGPQLEESNISAWIEFINSWGKCYQAFGVTNELPDALKAMAHRVMSIDRPAEEVKRPTLHHSSLPWREFSKYKIRKPTPRVLFESPTGSIGVEYEVKGNRKKVQYDWSEALRTAHYQPYCDMVLQLSITARGGSTKEHRLFHQKCLTLIWRSALRTQNLFGITVRHGILQATLINSAYLARLDVCIWDIKLEDTVLSEPWFPSDLVRHIKGLETSLWLDHAASQTVTNTQWWEGHPKERQEVLQAELDEKYLRELGDLLLPDGAKWIGKPSGDQVAVYLLKIGGAVTSVLCQHLINWVCPSRMMTDTVLRLLADTAELLDRCEGTGPFLQKIPFLVELLPSVQGVKLYENYILRLHSMKLWGERYLHEHLWADRFRSCLEEASSKSALEANEALNRGLQHVSYLCSMYDPIVLLRLKDETVRLAARLLHSARDRIPEAPELRALLPPSLTVPFNIRAAARKLKFWRGEELLHQIDARLASLSLRSAIADADTYDTFPTASEPTPQANRPHKRPRRIDSTSSTEQEAHRTAKHPANPMSSFELIDQVMEDSHLGGSGAPESIDQTMDDSHLADSEQGTTEDRGGYPLSTSRGDAEPDFDDAGVYAAHASFSRPPNDLEPELDPCHYSDSDSELGPPLPQSIPSVRDDPRRSRLNYYQIRDYDKIGPRLPHINKKYKDDEGVMHPLLDFSIRQEDESPAHCFYRPHRATPQKIQAGGMRYLRKYGAVVTEYRPELARHAQQEAQQVDEHGANEQGNHEDGGDNEDGASKQQDPLYILLLVGEYSCQACQTRNIESNQDEVCYRFLAQAEQGVESNQKGPNCGQCKTRKRGGCLIRTARSKNITPRLWDSPFREYLPPVAPDPSTAEVTRFVQWLLNDTDGPQWYDKLSAMRQTRQDTAEKKQRRTKSIASSKEAAKQRKAREKAEKELEEQRLIGMPL
ncbi:hypothetical protein CALCODRAFT_505137 [Calocera cornea HHB12733]|uniref:Uncharacterized protein n=1 Tax=Calocera cornea HHB12733 TaxID=1353952 RepID=A0A165BZY1_9BASI|nr:hypothetical protein CALCODRAFT_505137 [Calocera cornea HHB12733]